MSEGIVFGKDNKQYISANGMLVNIDDAGICLRCGDEDKSLEFDEILNMFRNKEIKISFVLTEKIKEEK